MSTCICFLTEFLGHLSGCNFIVEYFAWPPGLGTKAWNLSQSLEL